MSKIGTSLVVGIAVVATIFATISVLSLTGKINFANEGAKILHGEVVYAYGDVYKEKGGELVKIGDGEIINEGDVIKTNADSKATVLFDDGSIVRLSDNTQIEIKDIKKDLISINEILSEPNTMPSIGWPINLKSFFENGKSLANGTNCSHVCPCLTFSERFTLSSWSYLFNRVLYLW